MKNLAMFPGERARAYLAKCPGAVSGKRGHDQTFAVACKLVEFGLSYAEAWELLAEYNARCTPPWSSSELRHKLDDAFRLARPQPRFPRRCFRWPLRAPCAPAPSRSLRIDPVTAVENFLAGFRCEEVDIWEASPIRPPSEWTQDALAVLAFLFERGEQINFVTAFTVDKDNRASPRGKGDTIERDALMARWRKQGMPRTEAGGWLRLNPLDGQGVGDANVTALRLALVECDAVPLELQMPLLAKLPLPIAAIVSSGGRSLHAWVKVDAENLEDYRKTVAGVLALLAKYGVDGKNKNPSRMSRLPGVVRRVGAVGNARQRLLYLNPHPAQKAIL